MMNTKLAALVIFIAAYVLFVFLPKKRTQVAVIGAALLITSGVISLRDAFFCG